jgi:SAM-dependent methyltransferase
MDLVMRTMLESWAVESKSLARRTLGIPDPWGDFRRLLRAIHPSTWSGQQAIYEWLDQQFDQASIGEPAEAFDASPDPVVRLGWELRQKVLAEFQGKYAGADDMPRVLVFTPSYNATAAGYSLFRNLAEGFNFIGVVARLWHQGEPLGPHLWEFAPSVLLANDPEEYDPANYLENFDWDAVQEYRRSRELRIGLVGSPYPKDPTVWAVRLAHARRLGVSFFYAFQAPSFIARHHQVYRDHGFPVLSLEFGANPLAYYPVPAIGRDLGYVFLGSAHFEKAGQYYRFFREVAADVPGLIAGPYWPQAARSHIPEPLHRYLYARGKVGLNVHAPFQLNEATELNERAYNLAACGVPQLTDAPKLLFERFRPGSVWVGTSPAEYLEQYYRILARPGEAQERAMNGLEDVLTRHTVFHRAAEFIYQLASVDKRGWFTGSVIRDAAPRRIDYCPGGPHEEFIVPLLRARIQASLRDDLPPAPRVVLDVGCGRQPFRHLLESPDSRYVGMDVAQSPEGSVDVVSAIDAPPPPKLLVLGPFDFILCTEVLEHVVDWGTAFANFTTLLRPGGRILITCPHFYMLHEEPYDFWRPTVHAVRHFGQTNGLAVVRQEAAGDGWDVLGTMLACCAAAPHRPGLFPWLGAKSVNAVRRLAFALLQRRIPHRLARLQGTYLSNVVLLVKR